MNIAKDFRVQVTHPLDKQLVLPPTQLAEPTCSCSVSIMSGLETLAALGLVCNVFQITSFAGELYTTCTRLLKGETPDADLSKTLVHLNAVFDDVTQRLNSATQTLTQNDRQLLAIAKEGKAAATALEEELDKF